MMSASVRDLKRSSHVPGAIILRGCQASRLPSRDHAGRDTSSLSAAWSAARRTTWKPLPSGRIAARRPHGCRLRPVQPKTICAPVRRPRWMDPLGCPSTSEQALQPTPVHVHDPEPIVDSSRPSATEGRSGGCRGPSSRQNSQSLPGRPGADRCRRCSSPTTGRHPGRSRFSGRMRAMRLPSRDEAGACSPVVVNCWRRPFG